MDTLQKIDFNEAALDYNREILSQLLKTCEPLFKHFGITFFSHSHFLKDSNYLGISTNLDWQAYYMKHFANSEIIRTHVNHVFKNNLKYTLWENLPIEIENKKRGEYIKAGFGFKIYNRFTVYKKSKNSLRAWSFATDKEDKSIINFYINYTDLLERFILYFENKMQNYIDIFDSSKLINVEGQPFFEIDQFSNGNMKEFINSTNIERFGVHTENGVVYLSRREAECASQIEKSKTMKEIAQNLNISPRTVEAHINNVKMKLSCFTKSEVAEVLSKNKINNYAF